MERAFIADEVLRARYGLDATKEFSAQFSGVSVEGVLLHLVATAIWVLERIFDTHTAEINAILDTKRPHTLRWYVQKALDFQFGDALVEDTDRYAVLSPDKRVVRYAAAVEHQGKLYIKVAGEKNGVRAPLDNAEALALQAYFARVRDAGVKMEIISDIPNSFTAKLLIYYNPMVLSAGGIHHITGVDVVRTTVRDYLENLPFNGEYRHADLIDRLQRIDGVVIPELLEARSDGGATRTMQLIDTKEKPYSGYYSVRFADLVITYKPYQTIDNI